MSRQVKKRLIFSSLILGIMIFAVFGLLLTEKPTPAQTAEKSLRTPTAFQNAFNNREIRLLELPEWKQNNPLRRDVGDSQVIVVGTPLSNFSTSENNGENVRTEYQFKIKKVLKGEVRENEIIKVNLPGGLIKLNNGDFLEVRAVGFEKLVNQKTYLLLLNPESQNRQSWKPLRGIQGIYELPKRIRVEVRQPPIEREVIHFGRNRNVRRNQNTSLTASTLIRQIKLLTR